MNRLENWEGRLFEFIGARRKKPFQWGVNDCALFACDAALAISGTDLAADFRGHYSSPMEALGAMREFAGDLEAVALKVAAQNGLSEILPLQSWRGDVVLFEGEHGPTLGIVGLSGEILSPGPAGLVARPLAEATRAWRIG